jgi:hypothetical protein
VHNAESEILVSAYGLTTGSGIVEALARAKGRGVDIRLIADKTTPCGRSSGVPLLADAGVPIWIDDQARIAHEKAISIVGMSRLGSRLPTREITGSAHLWGGEGALANDLLAYTDVFEVERNCASSVIPP